MTISRALLTIFAALVLVGPARASGFDPQPDPPGDITFGAIAVQRDQSLRVTVTNLASSGRVGCRATVSGIDDPNQLVVAPGRAASVALAGTGAAVRPVVHTVSDPEQCRPGTTAELLGADGTVVASFIPQPS